jgi:LMBR1 domain-containing protein 1
MLMAGTSVNPTGVRKSKMREALCWTFAVIVVSVIFAATYFLLNQSDIPVQEYTVPSLVEANSIGSDSHGVFFISQPLFNETTSEPLPFNTNQLSDMNDNDKAYMNAGEVNQESETITMQVGISTFFAGLMAWVGWFLFAPLGVLECRPCRWI